MNPFESINLNQSVTPRAADHLESSSDDGLDPNDFLSSGGRPETAAQTDHLHTLENSIDIPTLLPSQELDTSAVLDSVNSSIFNLESFSFSNLNHVQGAQTDSTIKYLRNRHNGFVSEVNTAIEVHMDKLKTGEDCSDARNLILGLFDHLSENCLEQCEIYTRELSNTQHTLAYFQNLDRQRLKVLRRIKSIKSDKNEFGAKLDSLLAQRTGIDTEIEALEARLQALQAKRSTINVEIDGTISVLESKSTKYVNYFRHLETSGKSAIVDYLSSSSVFPKSIATYLNTEKVSTSFSSTNHSFSPISVSRNTSQTTVSTISQGTSPKASDMGIQALEIPEEISKTVSKTSNPAYDQGFDTASKQLESIKKGVSSLVHAFKNASVEDAPKQKAPRKLDDSSNTISEKLDFSPIFQLLTSKIDTLKQFEIQSSKISQLYRTHSAIWLDTCKFLEKQESSLFHFISASESSAHVTSTIQRLLKQSKRYLEECLESATTREDSNNFLQILIEQELFAVNTALGRLLGHEKHDNEPPSSKSPENNGARIVEKPENDA